MKRGFLLLALLTASSATATAQTIVFQDGFENGFAQWTATGLWNAVQATNPCMATATPFPEGVGAAWYGMSTTCDFATATPNTGRLELSSWVLLPSNVASVTLYFESYVHTEYCRGNFDLHEFAVMAQNGPDPGFTGFLCANVFSTVGLLPWHERRVDLTAYRGAQVRVAFEFRSVDIFSNYTIGWLLDNVRIVAEPGVPYCPNVNPYTSCPCTPFLGWGGGCRHSGSQSATLMSGGVASVASDSLTFTAAHMPIGTTAILFQGTIPITSTTTFGDGLMCVGGALMRMGTTLVPTDAQTWPLIGAPSLSVTGVVPAAGGDRFYQVFFRDAATFCTPETFNLTSAEKVTWAP